MLWSRYWIRIRIPGFLSSLTDPLQEMQAETLLYWRRSFWFGDDCDLSFLFLLERGVFRFLSDSQNPCCGFGSAWIRIDFGRIDPDPGWQKWPTKIDERVKIFHFWSGECSLRAEGFTCSLDVRHGGLGISKLQFFLIKNINFFSFSIFFQYFSLTPWLWSCNWIRICNWILIWNWFWIRIETNADPHHWIKCSGTTFLWDQQALMVRCTGVKFDPPTVNTLKINLHRLAIIYGVWNRTYNQCFGSEFTEPDPGFLVDFWWQKIQKHSVKKRYFHS